MNALTFSALICTVASALEAMSIWKGNEQSTISSKTYWSCEPTSASSAAVATWNGPQKCLWRNNQKLHSRNRKWPTHYFWKHSEARGGLWRPFQAQGNVRADSGGGSQPRSGLQLCLFGSNLEPDTDNSRWVSQLWVVTHSLRSTIVDFRVSLSMGSIQLHRTLALNFVYANKGIFELNCSQFSLLPNILYF